MRERGEGYYTIGSAGHESNAYIGAALRSNDPALLHYRSGGFYLSRVVQSGRSLNDGMRDVLLGLAASTDDPAAGGRHKVFGHPDLAMLPQTSTIASHLPRAVGMAVAVERGRRLGVRLRWPADAVIVASFGDASINHSTATGALNTAAWMAHTGLPLPVLFVCEDNGLGISVPTPSGWVAAVAARPGISYFLAEGDDPLQAKTSVAEAVDHVRRRRQPVLLHLRTVRYLGHAGTDVETSYRKASEIAADRGRDPILALARLLVESNIDNPSGLVRRYDRLAHLTATLAAEVVHHPKLSSRKAVMEPLARRRPTQVAQEAVLAPPDRPLRPPELVTPGLTLAQTINACLADQLAARPQLLVFGEDVGRHGGVYGVTRGLSVRFGGGRVFDTILDEQAILGLALGAGACGFLPVPEIQYLAYLHNAEDQLRGEAASQTFFSAGSFRNPMVVRVAGLGYQQGFGGHFHNDNALAVLRDIPGLVVGVPAHPADAAPMLRTMVAAAAIDGTVSVLIEPIALYHQRDLHRPGDGEWLAPYLPPADWPAADVAVGAARTHGHGTDLTIITFGNGLRMSLRVARRLEADGIFCRVVDMRWVMPLPLADIVREARNTGRVLVVDETRNAGGVGEGVLAGLLEAGFDGPMRRVASADSFIPLGPAAQLVLLTEAEIDAAARGVVAVTPRGQG